MSNGAQVMSNGVTQWHALLASSAHIKGDIGRDLLGLKQGLQGICWPGVHVLLGPVQDQHLAGASL